MLIQAQNQRERESEDKFGEIGAFGGGDKEKPALEAPAAAQQDAASEKKQSEAQEINIKEQTPESASKPSQENEDVEMKDASEMEKAVVKVVEGQKNDAESKEINIDPRTYCKLGHFHLLLEDYAKGEGSSASFSFC